MLLNIFPVQVPSQVDYLIFVNQLRGNFHHCLVDRAGTAAAAQKKYCFDLRVKTEVSLRFSFLPFFEFFS